MPRFPSRILAALLALGLLSALGPAAAMAFPPSGGAPIGGLDPNHHVGLQTPAPSPGPTSGGTWITDAAITEYWPAPESWFVGKLVSAPGLTGLHRVDWLYSASGVSMQGEGYGLDGRMYHINALGKGGWVTRSGRPTSPANGWKAGPPFWRAGAFWRNPLGAVSFPWRPAAGSPVPDVMYRCRGSPSRPARRCRFTSTSRWRSIRV